MKREGGLSIAKSTVILVILCSPAILIPTPLCPPKSRDHQFAPSHCISLEGTLE